MDIEDGHPGGKVTQEAVPIFTSAIIQSEFWHDLTADETSPFGNKRIRFK